MIPLRKKGKQNHLAKAGLVLLALFLSACANPLPEVISSSSDMSTSQKESLEPLCGDDLILRDYTLSPDINTYNATTYSSNLAYYVQGSDVAVTIGTCTDAAIVIPPYFNSLAVTGIMESGFANASNVTSITLPSGLTLIGSQAFKNTKITSIAIPAGITLLNPSLFLDCTSLSEVIFNTSTLTKIDSYCFSGCSAISEITLPNSITEIASAAFMGCYSLIRMILPTSLVYLRAYAFQGCSSLLMVHFSIATTTCENYAFKGCPSNCVAFFSAAEVPTTFAESWRYETMTTNVRTVFGVGDLRVLDNFMFSVTAESVGGDSSIKEITIYYYNGSFPDDYTEANKDTYTASVDLIIPAELHSGSITYRIVSVGENAFYGHYELRSIRFFSRSGETIFGTASTYSNNLSYLRTIETQAFFDCRYLESLDFSLASALVSIGTNAFQRTARYQAYLKVASLVIPANVTTISDYAFSFFRYLTSLTFASGSGLTTIGSRAFESIGRGNQEWKDASNVPMNVCSFTPPIDLVFPASLTSIGSNAFEYATCLKSITFTENANTAVHLTLGSSAFKSCFFLQSLTLSHNITNIGGSCFSIDINSRYAPQYPTLHFVSIPNSVTTFGTYAFSGLLRLSVVFEASNISSNNRTNLLKDGSSVCPDGGIGFGIGRNSSTSGYIPSLSYTNVGAASSQRHYVEVNDANYGHFYFLQNAANSAYATCIRHCYDALAGDANVVVPRYINSNGTVGTQAVHTYEVTAIGDSTFFASYSALNPMTTLKLPDSITSLGALSFAHCKGLSTVSSYATSPASANANTLPSALKTLQYFCFFDCSALTAITINSALTAGNVYNGAFLGDTSLASLQVGAACTTYASENNILYTADYLTLVAIPAGISASAMPTLTIHDGCTTVSANAGKYCRFFSTLSIPYSVSSIEANAFDNIDTGTNALATVSFYQGNSSAESPSLSSIGTSCFYARSSLRTLTIPSAVTSIGSNAFNGCSVLGAAVSGGNPGTINGVSGGVLDLSNNSLATLGDSSFRSCSALTKVILSSGSDFDTAVSMSIGANAFYSDTNIASVILPAGVSCPATNWAFNACRKLVASTSAPNSGIFLLMSGEQYDVQKNSALPNGWNYYASGKPVTFGCYSASDPTASGTTGLSSISDMKYWRYVSNVPTYW